MYSSHPLKIKQSAAIVLCLLIGSALTGCSGEPEVAREPAQDTVSSSSSSSSIPESSEESESSEPVSKPESVAESSESSEPEPDSYLQQLTDSMSLEEKVGQMFIARCPVENAAEDAAEYHLGGYILFARDFESNDPQLVTSNIQSYQDAADIPMLIGVDEEGGTVNPEDFIYERSFGADAFQTAEYVKTVVTVMKQEGIGSVLKHFPGYGNNSDTHTGIAHDERSFDTFSDSDFIPFQAGIDAGADMVLVSHNIVSCMDSEKPASLSPTVHDILRNRLGLDGVIMTDDLSMDGIRDFTDDQQAAVMAVLAGNDLICCTDYQTQIPAVIEATASGEISEQMIDEAVMRILKMKESLGLLETDSENS